jgi:putative endonuclease
LTWVVYILECADKTLYTGITTNIAKRIAKHDSGTGAKYTRGRSPVNLLYTERHDTRSEASKREIEIKGLNRIEKLKLIPDLNHPPLS